MTSILSQVVTLMSSAEDRSQDSECVAFKRKPWLMSPDLSNKDAA